MKMKKLIATSSLAIILASVGTASVAHANDSKILGTLLGAAGGAAVGSNVGKGKGNIVAIAVGTLLGAGVGGSVGRSVGHNNSSYYKNTAYTNRYRANPVYGNTDYVIPNHQYVGYNAQPVYSHNTLTSVNAYMPAQRYCREFTQTIMVGGQLKESFGTACRKPDGAWEIQN